MARSAEESGAIFTAWAASYDDDLLQADGPLTGYAASLKAAARMVDLAAGAEVLDIGVGTGAFAALFEASGVRITGIDPTPAMLERCALRHPGFALSLGDFAAIPFPGGRFDAVVSSFAFHEVPAMERAAACAEIARVIEPGGTLCLLDIIFASPAARDEARYALADRWDDGEDYPLVGAVDAALRAAGFRGSRWQQTAPCHWAVRCSR